MKTKEKKLAVDAAFFSVWSLPMEDELLFAFGVSADAGFFDDSVFGLISAEGAVGVLPVGWLHLKNPAASWAFKPQLHWFSEPLMHSLCLRIHNQRAHEVR